MSIFLVKQRRIGGFQSMKWKEKFVDPDVLKWIPIGLTAMILVVNVVQFGICKFQTGQEQKLLLSIQKQVEALKQQEEDTVIREEQTVSALSLGKKVAELETEYSDIYTSMLLFPEADMTAYEKQGQEVVKELQSYFSDDSYQDVWFPGLSGVKYPTWDFGTKYNISKEETEFPVIWTCYDSNVGNTVLAYTTAIFDLQEQKFHDAQTVMTNVSDVYRNQETSLSASLLNLLQEEPVSGESAMEKTDGQDIPSDQSSEEDEIVITEEEPEEGN